MRIVTFVAVLLLTTFSGYRPTYKWEVTNGKIVKGQGSLEIEVEVSGQTEKKVTAKLTIPEMDPLACPSEASCSCEIRKRP
jgi:hypothetical protein